MRYLSPAYRRLDGEGLGYEVEGKLVEAGQGVDAEVGVQGGGGDDGPVEHP